MKHYCLEVIRGIDVGLRYPLPEGAVSIGRSSQNAVALNPAEKSVSAHHAILYRTGDSLMLQDMQSTNGTFVNEEQVAEKTLTPNDTVGFGKSGPRLRLVASDDELAGSPPPAPRPPSDIVFTEAGRTINDGTDGTGRTAPNRVTPRRTRDEVRNGASFDEDPFANKSATMMMEKKLVDKSMDVNEMKKLMSDSKRLGKILDRGNLANTQMTMLRAGHESRKKSQAQWFIILGVVLFLSAGAITFFAVRAFQYKGMVDHGKELKGSLDELERKIAEAQKDTAQGRGELRNLVGQLEQRSQEFESVKSQLHQDDIGKFYNDPVERRIGEILSRFGEADYQIPPQMVERVKFHIDVYSNRMKGVIARYLARREKYYPLMARVLASKKLPVELSYVSMVESGYNPEALSSAGARGLWQFMPSSGRHFGLRVDDVVDERLDPEKATNAAAEYFKQLIAIFGGKSSVMLALAAYNAGEGRVMGALRKIEDPLRNRDFWYIYRMGYLAEETNEYIPRIIALIILSEDHQKYGLAPARDAVPRGVVQAGDNGLVELEGLKRLGEAPE